MQENSLISGNIRSGLLRYSVPIILSMLATQLYYVADTMVIGLKLDASALAAASNASAVLMLFLFISGGIELGANLLIGSKKPVSSEKEISDLAYNVIFADFASSIVITVITFASFPALLRLINTPEEILSDAVVYGRIYSLGIPFLMYYDVSKQILISVGNPRAPLYFVLATSGLNIVLDFVLTGPMGVAGAALASSFSQAVGAAVIMRYLRGRVLVGKFSFGLLNMSSIKNIVRLSVPNVLQQMTGPVVSNIRQGLLGTMGVAAIAGFSCANKLLSLTSMAMGGFTQGLVIFIAQNLAVGQDDRIRQGVAVSIKIQMIFVAFMASVFAVLRNQLLRLFTSDIEAIAYGSVLLLWEPAVFFIQIITRAQEAKLRGRQRMTLYTVSSLTTTGVNILSTMLLVTRIGYSGFYAAAYVSGVYSVIISTALAKRAERNKK